MKKQTNIEIASDVLEHMHRIFILEYYYLHHIKHK